jgi:hypothetical protein
MASRYRPTGTNIIATRAPLDSYAGNIAIGPYEATVEEVGPDVEFETWGRDRPWLVPGARIVFLNFQRLARTDTQETLIIDPKDVMAWIAPDVLLLEQMRRDAATSPSVDQVELTKLRRLRDMVVALHSELESGREATGDPILPDNERLYVMRSLDAILGL